MSPSEIVREAPVVLIPISGGLVASCLSIAVLILSVRRWRLARSLSMTRAPSRVLELIGLISPALVAIACVVAIQKSRTTMLAAAIDPDQQPNAGVGAILGDLASICVGIPALVLSLMLAVIAYSYAAAARARIAVIGDAAGAAPGREPWSSAVAGLCFVAFGLSPVAWATFSSTLMKLSTYVALAQVEPARKVETFLMAESAARSILERGMVRSCVGAVVAAVIAAALLATTSPDRAKRAPLPARVPAGRLRNGGTAAVSATLAAAAVLAAIWFKRENQTPWPVGSTRSILQAHGRVPVSPRELPNLEGPDAIAQAPVLEVTASSTMLDREEDVAGALERRRLGHSLLHPGAPPLETVLLSCAPDAPATRVGQALATAARAGYHSVVFVLERTQDIRRPVLGAFRLYHATGARAALVDRATPGAIQLETSGTCMEMARRVAAERRNQHEPAIAVHDTGGR